jgi:heat shock protein beta
MKMIKVMSKKLVKKTIEMLKQMAEDDYEDDDEEDEEEGEEGEEGDEQEAEDDSPEKEEDDGPSKYDQFWKQFGKNIKLGVIEDAANRNKLAKLLRFSSTHEPDSLVSLDDYISRM